MDVAQNSISAKAALVQISQITAGSRLTVTITDNGRGMSAEQVAQVTNPFFTTRTTRDVGLGVPLFKMACEQTGGSFSIESELGKGTVVTAEFVTDNIDMTPVGDMNSTILLLITCNPGIDFIYTNEIDGKRFVLDTRELREILGEDVEFNNTEVAAWIRDYLAENEAELKS